MENFNKKAVSEVIEILNHTDKEIVEKIPQKFIDFLFENEDKNYIPNIDFYDENWENFIQEDTQAILALLYRDYIVSEDEKTKLLKDEQEEKLKLENELREKYNPDNIFKKKNTEENIQINNVQLAEIKETSWFKRALEKIMKFFGRKK
ncbi:MAG: hypothetical protein MR598_01675 [Erysipelotrichaceae bacterium]|nr:hypothetical protein [Erysipelotrichaceae bacterium]